jgi:GT2 family glycosyltransferase
MQLSVIILNYHVRHFLELCLESVLKATQTIESEIIVVDNHSQDDSCAMVKARFPKVKLIENQENFGFPKGNNLGVAAAKGKYICILNPDTVVSEHTFVQFLDFAAKHPNLGIMGGSLLDGAGRFLPESKRSTPTPWVALTKIFGLYKFFPHAKWFNQYYAGHLQANQTGKVDILVGAFMCMERALYQQMGGFDEACFMYSDDIDLSYLVQKSGRDNYYNAEVQLIHFKGESTNKDEVYIQRFQEAMEFFYAKHFKKSFLFSVGMKIGAFVFVRLKAKKTVENPSFPTHFLLCSKDVSLPLKIEKSLQRTVLLHNQSVESLKNTLHTLQNERVEIIFDTQSCSFQEIITFMSGNTQKNLTFKFILSKQDFLIGSNHSESKGEVINLI